MQLTINDVEGCKPNIIVFFDTDTLRFAENYSFLFNLNITIFYCSLDFYFNKCVLIVTGYKNGKVYYILDMPQNYYQHIKSIFLIKLNRLKVALLILDIILLNLYI